jgi:hypothetical protein
MLLSNLSSENKVALLQQVMKKHTWAKSKKSLKYLCLIELKTGKYKPQ